MCNLTQDFNLNQTSTDLVPRSAFLQHWYFHKEFMFLISDILPRNLTKDSRPSSTCNTLAPRSKNIVI